MTQPPVDRRLLLAVTQTHMASCLAIPNCCAVVDGAHASCNHASVKINKLCRPLLVAGVQ